MIKDFEKCKEKLNLIDIAKQKLLIKEKENLIKSPNNNEIRSQKNLQKKPIARYHTQSEKTEKTPYYLNEQNKNRLASKLKCLIIIFHLNFNLSCLFIMLISSF